MSTSLGRLHNAVDCKDDRRLHSSLYPSTSQCDSSAPPIRSLSPLPLHLGWPCDLLCTTECIGGDSVSVLSLDLKRPLCASLLSLESSWPPCKQARSGLQNDRRHVTSQLSVPVIHCCITNLLKLSALKKQLSFIFLTNQLSGQGLIETIRLHSTWCQLGQLKGWG